MGDPLTVWAATGAAASFIQIIDFTAKVVKDASELRKSANNALHENEILEKFTLLHKQLAERILDTNDTSQSNENAQAIHSLANECKCVSSDLLRLLESLKVGESKRSLRAFQSARKAAKTLLKRQDIEIKQRYLGQLNGQLSTALLAHLQDNQTLLQADISKNIQKANAETVRLITDSGDAILDALRKHQIKNDKKCIRIINSLGFSGMHSRRHTIPAACRNTFEWALASDSPLHGWLTSERSIFWVTGKAGAGKSTLMKFVADHQRTRTGLLRWAGAPETGIELITAQNYLWHPGVAMQRSEEGMLQSILYHILTSRSELAQLIATRWSDDLLNLKEPEPWSKAELMEALESVFQKTSKWARYCLFIDGLDEHEGEHSKLLATILTLSNYKNVKIMVSSREWNVFRNTFEHLDDKIYLHDLTHEDIHIYVSHEIGHLCKQNPIVNDLICSIVHKAMGVFIWVFLVTRSVREGLEEGDSIALMRQRVDELPSDLEKYFELIQSRVPRVYRKRTYQAFKLAQLTIGQDAPCFINDSSSFIRFWILSRELMDEPRFAFKLDLQFIPPSQQPPMYQDTRRFLGACCKDFLHLQPRSDVSQVEFLHRTVHDFLGSDEMRRTIDDNVPAHFKDPLFPLHVALARLKIVTGRYFLLWQHTIDALAKTLESIEHSEEAKELVQEYEKAAASYVKHHWSCGLGNAPGKIRDNPVVRRMAVFFASYELHTFIHAIVSIDALVVRTRIPNSGSIFEAALGLSSHRRFPMPKINQTSVQLLLQNFEGGPVWHKFLLKALTEHLRWTVNETGHVAKVVQQFVHSGADMQTTVNLPPEMQVIRRNRSEASPSPIEILATLFPEDQLEVIVGSMELLGDDWSLVHGKLGKTWIRKDMKSAANGVSRFRSAREALKLGRAISVAFFKTGLAGLGWEQS